MTLGKEPGTRSVLKKALVLGGIHAHIPLIQALKKMGFYTILVDYYEDPVARRFADAHEQQSALDPVGVFEIARRVSAELVISTCSDQLNVVACQVSEQLGLPHPYSTETALDVTHKLRMKQKMVAQGIPTAAFFCVQDEGYPEVELLTPDYPLIVKPVDNCGSKGVRKVEDPQTLAQAISKAFPLSRSRQVLIESFQSGREICVDCFVQDAVPHIISIYEKFNLYGDKTVIQCFRSLRPVALSPEVEAAIQTIVQQITTTFELRHTTLFIQTIVQGATVSVIEFAARAPGGIAYRATQLHSGFDLIQASIASFLHVPYPVQRSPQSDLITTNSIYGTPGVFGWGPMDPHGA